MKPNSPIIVVTALLASATVAIAQGPLSPSAPPGPTMLTLSQIEPRTPVDAVHTGSGGSAQFLITQPGSYYLTTNIVGVTGEHGINISANNVSLDLNGFSLVGTSNSYDGIYIHSGYHNITVRNGIISGWGAGASAVGNPGAGIVCYANNAVFEHIIAFSNTPSSGLDILASGCSVVDCTVSSNLGYGIVALTGCVVVDCTASGNSSDGINVGSGTGVRGCTSFQNLGNGVTTSSNCTVIACTASGNGDGVNVGNGCTVKDCTANGDEVDGIEVGNNCNVIGCTASGNIQYGINVFANCTVKDCTASGNNNGIGVEQNGCQIAGNTCSGNSYLGIAIGGSQNRIDSNTVGNNGQYGIYANSVNVTNRITRNSASGNVDGSYYNYAGNADYAPTGSVSTATNPWTNF